MRRLIVFFHGFDPRGPGVYHGLFRDGAKRWAERKGRSMSVSPRRRGGPNVSAWTAEGDGVVVETALYRWDDLVRERFQGGVRRGMKDALRYGLGFLANGQFAHLWRQQPSRALVLVTPFAAVSLTLLAPLALALLAGLVLSLLGVPFWPGALAALVPLGALSLLLLRRIDAKRRYLWLARDFAFSHDEAGGRVPAFEARKEGFVQALEDAIGSGRYDEVVVAGHSMGAAVAVSVVGRAALRNPSLAGGATRLCLLTLGQSIPVLGALPGAHAFRDELLAAATLSDLAWLDVAAAEDVSASYNLDPLALCRVERPAGVAVRPHLATFALYFHTTPETYKALRADGLLLHLHYLAGLEPGAPHDYFDLVLSPATIGERYGLSGEAGGRGVSLAPGP